MALLDIQLDDHSIYDMSSPESFQVVTVSSLEDLEHHADAWRLLAWEAQQGLPSLMPEWVRAFLNQCLNADERWLCMFAYRDARLLGVLPVVVAPHPILRSSYPVLRTPSDEFTPSGDILLAEDCSVEALQALLRELVRQLPGHVGLSMRGIRHSAPLWPALQSANEYITYTGTRSNYSFLRVSDGYDRYLSSLGHMRRNLKRFRKKLEAQGPVSVEIVRGAPEAEGFLPQFMALEAAGWKGRNGTAMADSPKAFAFYSELARSLSPLERFEWHVLRVKDEIAAAQMCIRCGGMLMLAKIAFNEDYADCRPGHVLTGEVLRNAFERPDIVEVNHLSNADSEGYWRMSYDEYVDVHLVRRSTLSFLFKLPGVFADFAYQNFIRPRIPLKVKKIYRAFRRRGERKPVRSAVSRLSRSTNRFDGSGA